MGVFDKMFQDYLELHQQDKNVSGD